MLSFRSNMLYVCLQALQADLPTVETECGQLAYRQHYLSRQQDLLNLQLDLTRESCSYFWLEVNLSRWPTVRRTGLT